MHPLIAFLPLWIFVALFKFGAGLHYTILPILGGRVLPVAVVGVIIAASSFGQLLLDVPAGMILDRHGYRRFLAVTTLCFIGAAAVLAFGLTPVTFIATVILALFGWLFFEPGVNAYLLAHVPTAFAGRAMALRDVIDSIGVVAATSIFTLIVALHVPTIGLLLAVILILAAIALTFVPRDRVSVHRDRKISTHHFLVRRTTIVHLLHAFRRLDPASSLLLVSGLASSMFYGIVWFVVPIVVSRGNGMSGIELGVFDFGAVLIGFLLGRLADRWNQQRLVFFGLLLFALAGTVIGFTYGLWFIIFGFFATTGDEMASISLWAWLSRLDNRHTEDAAIAGAIAMVHDLGWTIGPLIAGFLFDVIGPSWTIAVGAMAIFIAWCMSVIILGPRRALAPVRGHIVHLRHRRHKR